jgi:hypothetical protein
VLAGVVLGGVSLFGKFGDPQGERIINPLKYPTSLGSLPELSR